MLATRESLLTTIAADLMSREMVLIPKQMSMRGAARLLSQAKISGAPVIDDDGHCIGVISTTDFVRYTEKNGHYKTASCPTVNSWQIVEPGASVEECVADQMTKDPVTAKPFTSICDLARRMMDAHIHRVIVVDEENRPIGVVSSTDILAAVVRAGETESPEGT
jgi:CBS domain-containing protein